MRTVVATWKEPGPIALAAARVATSSGGSLLDALEAGLTAAEDDPNLIAIGRGSLPNSDGEIELDASIMEGRNLGAGAVCGLRGILPAISVARMVMDETPHVMLAGDQARRFAIQKGIVPQNLLTPTVCSHYHEYLASPERASAYVHAVTDLVPPAQAHDTVTMLACEDGHCVAASSTSGLPYKMPGRIGDSPIVGAGIYADDEVGCAGATGMGEDLWKVSASHRAVTNMRQGMSPQEACEEVARFMLRRLPHTKERISVVLALDKQGNFGAGVTSGTFHLWVDRDGSQECVEYQGLA